VIDRTVIDREATLSPGATNVLAVPLMLAVLAVCGAAFGAMWGWAALGRGVEEALRLVVFVPVFIGGILVHEGLHGFGWKVFGGVPRGAIRFGFAWKALMPYAHCTVPLRAQAYRWGAALPGLATGLLPVLVGLALGWGAMLVLGAILLSAAAGDALVLWAIREVPAEARVIDHPSKPGCYVLRDEAATTNG
jgi:hypothetical protein